MAASAMKTIKELIQRLRGQAAAPAGEPEEPLPQVFEHRGKRYLLMPNGNLVDPIARKAAMKSWKEYDLRLRAVNERRFARGEWPASTLEEADEEDPLTRRYKNI